MKKTHLVSTTEISVRFSEVDSMRIVWHGHYVKYMEEGREDFGRKYGISYLEIQKQGFMAPVVRLTCDFKKPLQYGETALVETRFINKDAAKLTYSFRIFRASDKELVATGESVQVFLNMDGELVLTNPEFFQVWKTNHGIGDKS
jgi:acyl-CoA thioester hydrolase